MKKQLTLETDKRKAKEGEYIDIRWDCPVCPDSLMLIFDSGHKTDKIVVSDSGSTRIAVPKCNGKFIIRLVAGIGGKKATQEVTVRVANNRKANSCRLVRFQGADEVLVATSRTPKRNSRTLQFINSDL